MKKIEINGCKCSFVIKSHTKIANSIRRALISDVETHAPKAVHVRENTSCQTDEYIAHRIGLIPFVKTSDDDTGKLSIHVSSRDAMAFDFVGTSFQPQINVPIIQLGLDQTLDLDVEFGKGSGSDHAKFSQISTVSYRVEQNNAYISFEAFPGVDPVDYLSTAVASLMKRVNDTIYFVETSYDTDKTTVS